MKYKLRVYSIWEYGQRKDSEGNPHQEDCTFPLPKDLRDSDRTFILCDGMGGHDAGEVASATVCETMGNSILKDGHDEEGIFTDDDLKNAIAVAFSALDKKDSGAEKKMGTTMTFLKLHNNGATIAHMGDSRVYHIRPGETGNDTRILFETEDHSLVNDLIKIGELTKEEARTSKQKNVITRAMQPNMDRKPKADTKHITDIKAGDYFYMCSDGMLEQEDMANGESLKNIFSNMVKSDEERVNILVGATKHNKDNHTALIIHIENVEGEVVKSEEEETALPQYDMALVEDDDSTEGVSTFEEATTTDVSKNDIGNTSEERTQIPLESNNEENLSESHNDKDRTDINKSSQTNAVVSADKKFPARKIIFPNSKSGVFKLIFRGILVAIFVALCIVGANYIPSCSVEKIPDNVDLPNGKQNNSKRENGGKRTQAHSQTETNNQGQDQAVALDFANSEAAQAATGEYQQQATSSNNNATTVTLPYQAGVINSDQQTLQEAVNK